MYNLAAFQHLSPQRDKLSKLVEAGKVSPEGSAWFTAASDPFHDFAIQLQGYPDMQSGMSTVQKSVHTAVISAPGAGAWDALILMTGVDDPFNSTITSRAGDPANNWGATGSSVPFNYITVITAPSGTDLSDINAVTLASGSVTAHPMSDNATAGRFIAGGFEVVNTTAQLYRSGAVTVGHYQALLNQATTTFPISTYLTEASRTTQMVSLPDGTIDNLMNSPTCITWEAKDGCYVPARFISDSIPVSSANAGITAVHASDSWYTSNLDAIHRRQFAPIEGSFARFSGLDPQTTLRLVSLAYMEFFPSWDPDLGVDPLMPNLTPSCPFDPAVLKLYGAVSPRLPAGVPRSMNPKGEYWKMILDGVDVALAAMTPLAALADPFAYGVPGIAVGVGKLASKGGRAAATAITEAKKRKQKEALQAAQRAQSRGVPLNVNAAGMASSKNIYSKQKVRPRKR